MERNRQQFRVSPLWTLKIIYKHNNGFNFFNYIFQILNDNSKNSISISFSEAIFGSKIRLAICFTVYQNFKHCAINCMFSDGFDQTEEGRNKPKLMLMIIKIIETNLFTNYALFFETTSHLKHFSTVPVAYTCPWGAQHVLRARNIYGRKLALFHFIIINGTPFRVMCLWA